MDLAREIFQNLELHHRSSYPKFVKNKFQPKRTSHIPLEPAFNVDHKYGHEIVQKLTYTKIQSRIAMTCKLWITISWWIMDGIARFKHQSTLCPRIYLNHMAIAIIKGFENLTFLMCSVEIVCVWLRLMKTDVVYCSRRRLVMISQLNNARPWRICQLPLKSSRLHSENWHGFLPQLLQQTLQITCKWWMLQKKAQRSKDSWRIDEKECMWKWRKVREFVRFWIGSEKVIIDYAILLQLRLYTSC